MPKCSPKWATAYKQNDKRGARLSPKLGFLVFTCQGPPRDRFWSIFHWFFDDFLWIFYDFSLIFYWIFIDLFKDFSLILSSIHEYFPTSTCVFSHEYMCIFLRVHVYFPTSICVFSYEYMCIFLRVHVYFPRSSCVFSYEHMCIFLRVHVYFPTSTSIHRPGGMRVSDWITNSNYLVFHLRTNFSRDTKYKGVRDNSDATLKPNFLQT